SVAYLAMELVDGTDLRDRLKNSKGQGLPAVDAVDIAQQVAEGLGYAHERGIVHRDIKPGNIMLQPRGQPKIMDFGLARMRVADHKTSTGMVLGTPKYMSPEQVAGQPVDQRSDIFSLGIVLFEMLTGTRLFAGAGATPLPHRHRRDARRRLYRLQLAFERDEAHAGGHRRVVVAMDPFRFW